MANLVDNYLERLAELRVGGVEAILEQGELLAEAKAGLEHGEWQAFCDQLPFSLRHAHRLRSVAEHKTLANRTWMSFLPDSIAALYILSSMAPSAVEGAIADGLITPGMSVAEARRLATGEPKPSGGRRPWALADAVRKLDRLLAGAPPAEHRPLAAELRARAQRLLGADDHADDHADLALKIIAAGYRALARKHHPDHGGDGSTMARINAAVDWLRAQVETTGR